MAIDDLPLPVQTTHEDATRSVAAIARAHQAASTQVMLNGWERLSDAHVTEIVDGCGILADALDAAAGYIVLQKAEAIAELVGMAGHAVRACFCRRLGSGVPAAHAVGRHDLAPRRGFDATAVPGQYADEETRRKRVQQEHNREVEELPWWFLIGHLLRGEAV